MFSWLNKLAAVGAVGLLVGSVSLAQPIIIFSENPAPGDAFPQTIDGTLRGKQIGTTNWYYNWTKGGQVGIRTDVPYNGNGSVLFDLPTGTGVNNPQAGIAFYLASQPSGSAFNYKADSSSIIAPFSALEELTYSWYRSSVSDVSVWRFPVVEINIDLDGNPATSAGSGYLRLLGPATAPVDTWVTASVSNSQLRGQGALSTAGTKTFSEWQSWMAQNYPSAVIVGFTFVAYGETGKTFRSAIDNVSWTIGGQTTSYTFEVVPEPASLLTLGAGIVGLLAHRRLRRAR